MKPPLRLGIAGLGTVGAALVGLLEQKQKIIKQKCGRDIIITAVSARSKKNKEKIIKNKKWFKNPEQLAKSKDIDVFVELIGGEDNPALNSVKAALQTGKPVITANKALLAKHGFKLAEIAEKNKLPILYEAAVAGAIPITRTMRQSLAADNIQRVMGILNGTCNYILTQMEKEKIKFQDALKQAQKLGYAEANPTFDVDGFDTAHKITILARLAFAQKIKSENVEVEGIRNITPQDIQAAKELGYRIKLMGITQINKNTVDTRVHPALIPLNSPIAEISGATNMVWVESDRAGTIMLSGQGAGGEPTASAVAGDICDVAAIINNPATPVFAQPIKKFKEHKNKIKENKQNEFFIHINVPDRPGMMAKITGCMAKQNISLESIVQHRGENKKNKKDGKGEIRPIILMTHLCAQKEMNKAIKDMKAKGCFVAKAQVIRIEKINNQE